MSEERFSIDFEGTKLLGDITPARSHPSLLLLHGAGKADRKRFGRLRELFWENKTGSCAFDFIGHGETGGNLAKTSLENRTRQALAVIRSLRLQEPLSIVAASMSGYTAIKLLEFCKVSNLIFFAPAIYASESYCLNFDSQFSDAIRIPDRWQETDAWEIVNDYSGNLLVFAAENDQVIPRRAIEKIHDSAKHARFREIITVKNATHPLGKWLDEHPDDLKTVFNKIQTTLNTP